MRNISKIINFFNHIYSNSIKFNHSIYHFLKIFYERANKSSKIYSNLGNVFRSSKWTNYKIQNIKISFLPSFIKLLLFILTFSIFIFNFKSNIFCLIDLFTNFISLFFKDIIYDYISFLMSVFLLYLYYLKNYISNFYLYLLCPSNLNVNKNIRFYSIKTKLYNINFKKKFDFNLSNSNNKLYNQHLMLAHTLFKIKNNLFWINYSDNINYNNTINIKNNNFFILNNKFLFFLNYDYKNMLYSYYLKDLNMNYKLSFSFTENVSTSINSNSINKLNKTFFHSSIFENILNGLINILKQSRWLSRNITISDRFIINTNYFTEYKKLIGSNLTSSKLSNNNVWASSNLNKVNFQYIYSLLSSYKNNFNSSYLVDKFDESRLWLFKKIYFNTLLRYSDTILNLKFNKDTFLKHNYFSNKFYFEFIKKSLPYNIMMLDNSIKFSYLPLINKSKNVNSSNFMYNLHDNNLLTDENIDNLINLFINSSTDVEKFYFYSNINITNDTKDELYSFDLKYNK